MGNGFYGTFCRGKGIDVGYGGGSRSAVLPNAIGVDVDYPGYDGRKLPFSDGSLDFVFSSHCLEHVPFDSVGEVLREWMRVIKVGGYLVICVPHKYLYEKKLTLPSNYNSDHRWFVTPGLLLERVEDALPWNSYRVRWLRDNDDGYDYSIPPERHGKGCYEIELVLEKINPPCWTVK
jgi:SAM-dependent methyltransferase